MGVFVSQAVGSRTEARAAAEETAYNILKQPVVVVVTSHREKFNGKIESAMKKSFRSSKQKGVFWKTCKKEN